MSVDMNSQGSDSNEEDYDPNCEEEEEDEDPGDIEDYYVGVANDVEQQGADAFDPEEYLFTCLTYKESESTLNEHMVSLASALKVSSPVTLGEDVPLRLQNPTGQNLNHSVCHQSSKWQMLRSALDLVVFPVSLLCSLSYFACLHKYVCACAVAGGGILFS